ncbi:Cytochrome p450 [Mycena sanguinolenta]|uniref:Cytochrome p450 n=1 Tax=Mycena sanguinolenta TaxID=230812 RepID=A0A8H6XXI0_9AGAR|nr:Cytochrome p450 [Mycena sanguinolenta]
MTAGFSASLLDWGSLCILASASIVSWYYVHARARKLPRLPPGPPGLPFLGNLFDIPMASHWLRFAEMSAMWGDIFSLKSMGQTMIITSLDIRGANFSDRPIIPVGGELGGFNNVMALVGYGDRVRKERKLFHQLFGTQAAIKQFLPLLSTETRKLLRRIVVNPDEPVEEIKHATGAITLRIAYGYQLRDGPERDPMLDLFETAGNNFFIGTTPAAFLADIIPVLRYWPEWLPGGGFHTIAKAWYKHGQDTMNAGLNYVKKAMAAGSAETSFVSALLEGKEHDDYLIKWAAGSVQIGGSDTVNFHLNPLFNDNESALQTAAQLEAFLLAMSLYPDVQAAAQSELDRVVGNDRLPEISDIPQLPYVEALCKEIIRWHVAAPLAVPHRTRDDYIYERGRGLEPLLIPKDSLIIPNLWQMAHDPERYANPMEFNPSRFIAKDGKEAEPDPSSICFGYGRRICPGKLLGETAMFLECSAILSVFNISKARVNGVIVEPQLGQTSTTISRVLPFKCVMEPRSARALALIQSD